MRRLLTLAGAAVLLASCADSSASTGPDSGCPSCLNFGNEADSGTQEATDSGEFADSGVSSGEDAGIVIIPVGVDSGVESMNEDAGTTPPFDAGTQPQTDAGVVATGDAGSQCTPDTYTNWAGGFFTTNCNSCHDHTHIELVAGYLGVAIDQSDISSKISSYSMPVGASLTTSDYNRILKWFSCGAPM